MAWAMVVCGCTAATAPEMMATSKPTDTGPDDVRLIERDPVGANAFNAAARYSSTRCCYTVRSDWGSFLSFSSPSTYV